MLVHAGTQSIAIADEQDQDVLRRLLDLFHHSADRELTLTGPEGETYELTEAVQHLLIQIVEALTQGRGAALQSVPSRVTVDVAGTLLNVPTEYVETLLSDDLLTSVESAGVRLIPLRDVLAYRRRRDKDRDEALAELTRLSQDFGLYKY